MGASGNLQPYKYFKHLCPNVSIKSLCKLEEMNVTLGAYNKSTIKQLGSYYFDVHFNGTSEQCRFFIVEDSFKTLLGLPDLLCLGLIKIHDSVLISTGSVGEIDSVYPKQKTNNKGMVLSKDSIINHRFESVFIGIGKLLVEPANIQLATDEVPVQKPLGHVPLALQDKFKDKLDHMESLEIIPKLDKNTATLWLNSLVLVKKPNGSLRVCLDPTDLNKYIVHPVCNMHTLDEINHLLKDAKFFSVFDTPKGFFQISLDH